MCANIYFQLSPTNRQHRDHSQTLSQNYKRLGLARRLNAPTGGIERNPVEGITTNETPSTTSTSHARPATDSLAITSSSTRKTAALIPHDVRIERDPVTGAILRVLDDTSPQTTKPSPWKPLDDPLAAYDSDSDSGSEHVNARHAPNQHHPHIPANATSPSSLADLRNTATSSTSIIPQLTAYARASTGNPRKRTPSAREQDWCARLVERYGEDYAGMVRDRELNVRQQTRGDIERRVRRWRETVKK